MAQQQQQQDGQEDGENKQKQLAEEQSRTTWHHPGERDHGQSLSWTCSFPTFFVWFDCDFGHGSVGLVVFGSWTGQCAPTNQEQC